jgi:hypothetical protein
MSKAKKITEAELVARISRLEKRVMMLSTTLNNTRMLVAKVYYSVSPSDFAYVPSGFRLNRDGSSVKVGLNGAAAFPATPVEVIYEHSLFTTQAPA